MNLRKRLLAFASIGLVLAPFFAAVGAHASETKYFYGAENKPLVLNQEGWCTQTIEINLPGGAGSLSECIDEHNKGQTRFTLTDHLGSSRVLIAETGEIQGHCEYQPFGRVEQTSTAIDCRYTGQEFDHQTALQNSHARFYDPSVGRFDRVDPQGQTFSAYDYVGNNPIMRVDPTGMGFMSWAHETWRWFIGPSAGGNIARAVVQIANTFGVFYASSALADVVAPGNTVFGEGNFWASVFLPVGLSAMSSLASTVAITRYSAGRAAIIEGFAHTGISVIGVGLVGNYVDLANIPTIILHVVAFPVFDTAASVVNFRAVVRAGNTSRETRTNALQQRLIVRAIGRFLTYAANTATADSSLPNILSGGRSGRWLADPKSLRVAAQLLVVRLGNSAVREALDFGLALGSVRADTRSYDLENPDGADRGNIAAVNTMEALAALFIRSHAFQSQRPVFDNPAFDPEDVLSDDDIFNPARPAQGPQIIELPSETPEASASNTDGAYGGDGPDFETTPEDPF